MKIGFDARCLEEEKISGVGEYALELLKNILEMDRENKYPIFSNSFKQKKHSHLSWLKNFSNAELKKFSFPNKILNLFFWYLHWPKIDKMIGGADIFFAPNINFLPTSEECRFVATFHDLSFERFPGFFQLKTRLWHNFFVNPRKIAKNAKKIIAVSESTKKDLEEIYQISPENIDVVRHGIRDNFRVIDRNDPKLIAIRKKYGLPHKFILYLGNIEPRKNIPSIIGAHMLLISRDPKFEKYKLVLAGNISPLCRKLMEEENIVSCGYIENEDRPFVYNLASLFVYPSFFEGFGLPVLEAMACGTPVIASNNSSIPEVTESAAILIDPKRSAEITEAVSSILTDEKLYDKMRERGLVQARKFSWKKTAKKTLKILESR
jgi:glycosyltransferase involved in cell wall biosynthesis